jgi:hypothetical protein
MEKRELDEKIAEIIPPLTPDLAANSKHWTMTSWIISWQMPL